jgi:subfamily B ATP-binding cassette protein MsbA
MIIPFLRILFGTNKRVVELLPWGINTIKHNVDYFLTLAIERYGASKALLILTLIVVAATILKTLSGYFANILMSSVINGIVRDFQLKIYTKILRLPVGYFLNHRKGDIISRITSDVFEVKASVTSSLDMIFREPLTILVFLVFLFIMNVQLTLFALVILPISGIFIFRLGRSLRKRSLAGQVKMGEIVSQVDETITGLRIIKAFNAESKMHQRFARLNHLYYQMMNRIAQRRALSLPFGELIGTLVVVNIIYFGGNIVLKNPQSFSATSYIAYLVVFSQVIKPARALANAYYNIQRGLASVQRIEHFLHEDEVIVNSVNANPINGFQQRIEYKGLSFRYTEAEVLKNINLTIDKGKSIALVGQSGAGKTTIVDLLPRFYDVTDGDILIDGVSVKTLKLEDLRALIGVVTQDAILFNDTFYNNIAFGIENATIEQVIAAAQIANAHEFIMATENGYDTNIGERGMKLSGGQQQRITIARAVLKNPPILILDEATSSLDTESESLVQEAITKLMKNRTSIIIAHRLSTIRNVDEIYVLHDGEIVENGTHEVLLSLDGYYKKLYDMQNF